MICHKHLLVVFPRIPARVFPMVSTIDLVPVQGLFPPWAFRLGRGPALVCWDNDHQDILLSCRDVLFSCPRIMQMNRT